jgi:hypothetical protein
MAVACLLALIAVQAAEARLSLFGRVLLPGRSSSGDTDLQDLLTNSDREEPESHPENSGEEMPGWVPESQKSSFDEDEHCLNWGFFFQTPYRDYTCCEGVRPNQELVELYSCIPFGSPHSWLAVCTYCGDGVCGSLECNWNCPEDCRPRPRCGNGVCEWTETVLKCPEDCCCPGNRCGDGNCDKGEKVSCPEDCPPELLNCGNGLCSWGENRWNCPEDCPGECGDEKCDKLEPLFCPQDCQIFPPASEKTSSEESNEAPSQRFSGFFSMLRRFR